MRICVLAVGVGLVLPCAVSVGQTAGPSTQPSGHEPVQPTEQPPGSAQSTRFDPAEYLTGDWLGFRRTLGDHGITITPQLVLDDSQNFQGGLRTGNSFRLKFVLPVSVDTGQLFNWPGGRIFAEAEVTHGGNASANLTGDVQIFDNETNQPQRGELGQLWYEQHLPGSVRVRVGKQDANTDFDNIANSSEFLNGAFATSPTNPLLPTFPYDAFGVQAFFEPPCGYYFGAGVFDGSLARGVDTGVYGPKHFWESGNDLFLIAETGWHYQLPVRGHLRPGDVGVGGWWNTNTFEKLDGTGAVTGTGGVYFIGDQLVWKPEPDHPVAAGQNPNNPAQPEEEEYPGGITACYSVGWADSVVNRVDGSATGGATWTGLLPHRSTDVAGLGATAAHFAPGTAERHGYELAIETFYRIRLTQAVSLKPDLQYIIHPDGGGAGGTPERHDALAGTLRLDVAF